MSNVGLFVMGFFVTLLVVASLGLLVWGAIMDGRYDDEQRVAEADRAAPQRETPLRAIDAA